MKSLRVISKTIGFVTLTLGAYLLWRGGAALLCFAPRAQRRWRGLALRAWAKAMLWLLGVRLRVAGPTPSAPFFLVANHLSYVDVLVLAAQVDCVFVAKSELAAWPLLGFLSRQVQTIFINRRRTRDLLRVNALLARTLAAGQSVALFPEGTTTAGAAVLPFKSALLEPAVQAGRCVAYASLSYRTADGEAPATEAVCWWGEMEFVPHLLKLFALPGFDATLVFGAQVVQARDRKTLAKQLHAAVVGQTVSLPPASERTHPGDTGKLTVCPTFEALLAANLAVLRQGLELLAQIDDEQYTATAAPFFAYGVGSHFRHCLDSYTCFLRGLAQGRIDYDERARDEQTAGNRRRARARIEWTMELLRNFQSARQAVALRVRQDGPQWAQSSGARELQFLLSHTVHHYALIALILRLQGFNPAVEFGVAPATLEYWQAAA